MNARVILKGLVLIVSFALFGWLFHSSEFGSSLNEAWIDAKVRGNGLPGLVLFLITGGLFTAIGAPRQIIAFLAGYAFGISLGTLFGALATFLGCVLAFSYARFLGQSLLRRSLRGRAERLDRLIREHPFSMTMLVRLLPVGSNLLINLAAGISNVRALPFFAGSLLGYLPQTLVFVLVGSGVRVDPAVNLSLAIILFLISGILGLWLYRRFASRALA